MVERPIRMERRLVLRLLHYWRGLGDAGTIPSEFDIEPTAVPDIWPHCALLDVAASETDPEITFAGHALIDAVGVNLSGKKLSQVPANSLIGKGLSYFGEVLVKKVPITYGGELVDRSGATIPYRSIILPLAEDGVTINRLLAAANCGEITR